MPFSPASKTRVAVAAAPARVFDAGLNGDWVHVADADRFGRGSLLPMAVFLTKNAPGLRTSPVKRGYWVVRRLLGDIGAPVKRQAGGDGSPFPPS